MLVRESQNGKSISLGVGDVIEVRLSDNPTTGYRWSPVDLGDGVLTLEDSGFHQTQSGVGGGGNAFWILRAKAVGGAQLAFKRWRPWEGDSSIVDRFLLNVDVAPAT